MKKNRIIIIIYFCFFYATIYSQEKMIKVPLVIMNRNQITFPAPNHNYFYFYKKGKEVARENFEYSPYELRYKENLLKHFDNNKVDSVVMVFYCNGIFDQQYEYKLFLDKSINFFSANERTPFELSIFDILNTKRNKKIIKKLGVPYEYSFKRYDGMFIFDFRNTDIFGVENFQVKGSRRFDELDYFNYREQFGSNREPR